MKNSQLTETSTIKQTPIHNMLCRKNSKSNIPPKEHLKYVCYYHFNETLTCNQQYHTAIVHPISAKSNNTLETRIIGTPFIDSGNM